MRRHLFSCFCSRPEDGTFICLKRDDWPKSVPRWAESTKERVIILNWLEKFHSVDNISSSENRSLAIWALEFSDRLADWFRRAFSRPDNQSVINDRLDLFKPPFHNLSITAPLAKANVCKIDLRTPSIETICTAFGRFIFVDIPLWHSAPQWHLSQIPASFEKRRARAQVFPSRMSRQFF